MRDAARGMPSSVTRNSQFLQHGILYFSTSGDYLRKTAPVDRFPFSRKVGKAGPMGIFPGRMALLTSPRRKGRWLSRWIRSMKP